MMSSDGSIPPVACQAWLRRIDDQYGIAAEW
jgi:hypothetical protein